MPGGEELQHDIVNDDSHALTSLYLCFCFGTNLLRFHLWGGRLYDNCSRAYFMMICRTSLFGLNTFCNHIMGAATTTASIITYSLIVE